MTRGLPGRCCGSGSWEADRDVILSSDELDRLAHAAVENCIATDVHEQTDPAGYDEATWGAYLAENLRRWDGTPEAWDQFAAWFVDYASSSGLAEPAGALIAYLAGLGIDGRIAACAQYGVVIATPTTPPQAGDPCDSGAAVASIVLDEEDEAILRGDSGDNIGIIAQPTRFVARQRDGTTRAPV